MNLSPLGLTSASLPSAVPARRASVSSGQLLATCRLAWEQGGQLVALWLSDERDRDRGYCLRVVLQEDADALRLQEIGLQSRPDGERDVLIGQDSGLAKARKVMERLLAAES